MSWLKYFIAILPTKYERVWYFVRRLRLSYHMDTQSLVAAGRSFANVSDYAKIMEEMHSETQGVAI